MSSLTEPAARILYAPQLGRARHRGAASDASFESGNQAPLPTGMVEQVRQNLEKANQRVYGKGKVLRFHDVPSPSEVQQEAVVCK